MAVGRLLDGARRLALCTGAGTPPVEIVEFLRFKPYIRVRARIDHPRTQCSRPPDAGVDALSVNQF